jgi:hypothetical protein
MSGWAKTYSHDFLIAFDKWCCATLFGVDGLTISTLSGLVRDGKDSAFKLHGYQRSFLRWLEPRLSRAHVEAARISDRARAQFVLDNTG